MNDQVNQPTHYTSGPTHAACGQPIECIDVTRSHTFTRGNAIKYLWRAGLKNADTHTEDLEKARWYITDEINRIKENQ